MEEDSDAFNSESAGVWFDESSGDDMDTGGQKEMGLGAAVRAGFCWQTLLCPFLNAF